MASHEKAAEAADPIPVKIKVKVNGKWMELPRGCTLPALIEMLGYDRRYLVIEYNGQARGRDHFDDLVLQEGDRLEMVRPVAGG